MSLHTIGPQDEFQERRLAKNIELLKRKYLNQENTDQYVVGGKSQWQDPDRPSFDPGVPDGQLDDDQPIEEVPLNYFARREQEPDPGPEYIEVDMTRML